MELSRDELIQRLRITRQELEEWTATGLLSPSSTAGDLFPESALEEGDLIKRFRSLGYALTEIHRIKRSVGLPLKDSNGRFISRRGFLTIGELAEKSGINVRTIKFWEEKGLISPYRRTEGGFRLYRPEDAAFLCFVKDLQTFNYTLSEIGAILPLIGPDLSGGHADLEGMTEAELEKTEAALEFLVGRMREVRDASTRVEAVFSRRLRAATRVLRVKRRQD